jgi:hypothetical protein
MSTPQLEVVLALSNGSRWVEIDSVDVAVFASHQTQTAVSHFYMKEADLEGGHPRRWFFLQSEDKGDGRRVANVVLCVLPDDQYVKHPDMVANCHTSGRQNKNPYPEFAADIEALADFTCLPIIPNWQGEVLPVPAVALGPSP